VGSADKSKLNYFKYLKTLVNRFALNYNVQFVGFKQDVENILKEARILVASSVADESFGRVIAEAFACGVPVIATEVGGFKDIVINGEDGILIEPRNSQAIADSILKILNDNTLVDGMTRKARDKVEKYYSMEKCLKETEEVYKKTLDFFRILVIKISSLGDLILSFPSLKEIKEYFPQSKICILTLKKYSSLLYGCPYIDEVITIDDNYKKFKNILNLSKSLRRKSFDYIIDLQNNRASHLISFLSFSRYSFGYSLRWGFLLAKHTRYRRSDDPLRSQERILELLGIRLKEKKLIFWDKKEEIKLSLPTSDLIGINISASSRWESKSWPLNYIVALMEMLYKNLPSFKIVLFGDENANEKAKKIESCVYPHPYNLCGKTSLAELPALIKKLKIFVTPDTATLHLACSLGVPTIALFGPTDPFRHTVKGKGLHLLYKKISCSFCYHSQCKIKEKNLCMAKISPQEVFLKIKDILGQ
jgi:heptosyltransferase-1